MPAAQWLLQNHRPAIEIVLSASGGQDLVRNLIADTGAGTRQEVFQLRQEWQFALQADKAVTPILRQGDYPLVHDELKS